MFNNKVSGFSHGQKRLIARRWKHIRPVEQHGVRPSVSRSPISRLNQSVCEGHWVTSNKTRMSE